MRQFQNFNGVLLFIQFPKKICGHTSHSDFLYRFMASESEEKRKRVVQFVNRVMTKKADWRKCTAEFHGGGRSQVYCL